MDEDFAEDDFTPDFDDEEIDALENDDAIIIASDLKNLQIDEEDDDFFHRPTQPPPDPKTYQQNPYYPYDTQSVNPPYPSQSTNVNNEDPYAPVERTVQPPPRNNQDSYAPVERTVQPPPRTNQDPYAPVERTVQPPPRNYQDSYAPVGRTGQPPPRTNQDPYAPVGRTGQPPPRTNQDPYAPVGRTVQPPPRNYQDPYAPVGRTVQPVSPRPQSVHVISHKYFSRGPANNRGRGGGNRTGRMDSRGRGGGGRQSSRNQRGNRNRGRGSDWNKRDDGYRNLNQSLPEPLYSDMTNKITESLSGIIRVYDIPLISNALQVVTVMKKFGEVTQCRLPLNHSIPTGEAEVMFKEYMDATKAVSHSTTSGIYINGVKVYVDQKVRKEPNQKPPIHAFKFWSRELHLGLWLSPTQVELKHQVKTLEDQFQISFNGSQRSVHVYYNDLKISYRIKFHFKDICKRLIVQDIPAPRSGLRIIFNLRRPPALSYKQSGWFQQESRRDQYFWQSEESEIWSRATDLSNSGNMAIFGKYLIWVIFIDQRQAEKQNVKTMLIALRKFGIFIDEKAAKTVTCDIFSSAHHKSRKIHSNIFEALPFRVYYALQCLITWRLIAEEYITDRFMKMLSEKSATCPEKVELALYKMWTPEPNTFYYDPEKKFDDVFERTFPIKDTENIMWVRRVCVTPSKTYFIPPQAEISNRITRRYNHLSHHFLRVSISDEDLDHLNGLHADRHIDLVHKVVKVLTEGVYVGKMHYVFLAFSSAQLREGSFWAFSPTKEITTKEVYQFMGDFREINIIGKYTARMGQCFSTTTSTGDVLTSEVCHLPDIKRNGYIFSDGIGQISIEHAKQLTSKLNFRNGYKPSAFQIRFGGSKGVVAIHPPLTAPYKLALRDSMIKFQCDFYDLEINSHSKPTIGFLNRQIIKIISDKGIPDQVFEMKQTDNIERLEGMLVNPQTALSMVKKVGGGYFIVTKALEGGFPSTEPFLQAMMLLLRTSILRNIKSKSKIMIPDSRLMMGVLDEFGVLKYGQVYVQYTKDINSESNERVVHEGPVIVAKNPCLHPGDVRMFMAVNRTRLSHLYDTLVFPSLGHRPHPNECSGSDLDGDLYFVTWDHHIITYWPKENDPPMDYSPPTPNIINEEITVKHIQEFYVTYIKNESLGIISNAHVALSDFSPYGVKDPKCLELARLHSQAVDFPKTGKPAKMSRDLKTRIYPDFMEKAFEKSYESDRVIGRMYRAVSHMSKKLNLQNYENLSPDPQLLDNPLTQDQSYQSFIEQARSDYRLYSDKLKNLMKRYGVSNEAEIVSGELLEVHWHLKKKNNHWSAKQAVEQEYTELRKQFENIFWKQFVSTLCQPEALSKVQLHQLNHHIIAKAIAWYDLAYRPKEAGEIIFLGFAWLNVELLCLAKKQTDFNFDVIEKLPLHLKVIYYKERSRFSK